MLSLDARDTNDPSSSFEPSIRTAERCQPRGFVRSRCLDGVWGRILEQSCANTAIKSYDGNVCKYKGRSSVSDVGEDDTIHIIHMKRIRDCCCKNVN